MKELYMSLTLKQTHSDSRLTDMAAPHLWKPQSGSNLWAPPVLTHFLIFFPSSEMLFYPFLPEFDKFLEERAKVADRLPTVPSPPTGVPTSVASSSPHRKKDKEEDAMFAL